MRELCWFPTDMIYIMLSTVDVSSSDMLFLFDSFSIWHPCSTCAIGSCLNEKFIVNGVTNLRVVDMSSFVSCSPN